MPKPTPEPTLSVWTNTKFKGFWPIGTAAVMIAKTRREAAKLLNAELKRIGLPESAETKEMVKIDLTSKNAIILHDGDH